MERNNDFSILRQLIADFFGTGESSNPSLSKLVGLKFPDDNEKYYNKVEEVSETETHSVKTETWTSLDGKAMYVRTVSTVKEQPKDDTKSIIERLEARINDCIRSQEFEEAARIRDEIKNLKKA